MHNQQLPQQWQPSADQITLKARARLNQQIRHFLDQRGVLEVETPALSQSGNTDPHINSFLAETNTGTRYLHTSPEYPMKRLLAAGSGDIYQICKVWREEENGPRHNSEFTLLEYYRVGFSYQRLMQEVDELLTLVLPNITKPSCYRSYQECFLESLAIDPHIASLEQLKNLAATQSLDFEGELDKQGWLDLLFTHVIEADFDQQQLTFVYYYPAQQAALAAVTRHDGTDVAQRFEVYCGAMELGNGYQELTDAGQNNQRLHQDAAQRAALNLSDIPVDQRFLAALEQGMPRSAGVAIGLDRLLLCGSSRNELKQVISFAWELA